MPQPTAVRMLRRFWSAYAVERLVRVSTASSSRCSVRSAAVATRGIADFSANIQFDSARSSMVDFTIAIKASGSRSRRRSSSASPAPISSDKLPRRPKRTCRLLKN